DASVLNNIFALSFCYSVLLALKIICHLKWKLKPRSDVRLVAKTSTTTADFQQSAASLDHLDLPARVLFQPVIIPRQGIAEPNANADTIAESIDLRHARAK